VVFLRGINSQADEHIRETAEITMAHLDSDIQKALALTIDQTGLASSFIAELSSDLMEETMKRMLEVNPEVFEMYYGTSLSRFDGGNFFTATNWDPYGDNPEWDQVKRPWFITALQSPGKTIITEPYLDSQTGRMCISMVNTVENESGKIIGVVGTDMFIDVLTDIVNSRKITPDGTTYLINGEGLYITYPDPAEVMKKNIFDDLGGLNRTEILSPGGSASFSGNRYVCSASVSGTSWFLVSSGSLDTMRSASRRSLRLAIIITVILAILAAVISVVFILTILKPLNYTMQVLKEIGTDWDLTRRIEIQNHNELGELAVFFQSYI
jgi:methyl-accepting chemotaxis protein